MKLHLKFKIANIVSLILGICVAFASTWTLARQLKFSEGKIAYTEHGIANKTISNNWFNTSTSSPQSFTQIHHTRKDFWISWRRTNPAMVGSCIAVFCAAAVQCITSLIMVINSNPSSKIVSKRIGTWLMIHLVIFTIFLTCLFIPLTMDRNEEVEDSVKELFQKIRNHFNPIEISSILGQKVHAYYISIGISVGYIFVTLLCVVSSVFFNQKLILDTGYGYSV